MAEQGLPQHMDAGAQAVLTDRLLHLNTPKTPPQTRLYYCYSLITSEAKCSAQQQPVLLNQCPSLIHGGITAPLLEGHVLSQKSH